MPLHRPPGFIGRAGAGQRCRAGVAEAQGAVVQRHHEPDLAAQCAGAMALALPAEETIELLGSWRMVIRNAIDNWGVTREPVRALTSFEIEISPAANAAMADTETQKFDLVAFRGVVQRTLDAAKLVSPDGDFKLTVTIDELRVRSTFDAMMWGFMAGTDQLNGTATLNRLDGGPVGSFKVGTSYGLGGFAGGQDSSRVVWLYEEFAKLLTQELVALRDQGAKP